MRLILRSSPVLLALGLAACGGGGGGALPPASSVMPVAVATKAPVTSVQTPAPAATVAPSAAPTAAPAVALVGIGDSIMAGSYSAAGVYSVSPTANYLYVASQMDGIANETDLAVPGYYAAEMLNTEVPQIPASTNEIVIADGTNDVEYAQPLSGLDTLVSTIVTDFPKAHIILVASRNFQRNGVDYTAGMEVWDAEVRRLAGVYGTGLLDMETDPQWYNSADWYDGVHPSPSGVTRIATALAPLLH